MAEPLKARIDFSLTEPPKDPGILDEERKKHQQRAERFGTGYRDPSQRKEFQLEAKKERLAVEGFVTGIDMFSEAEKAKRAARAAKFGRQQTLVYAPDPEEMRKAERAAKFGTSYHADGALMDMDLFEERTDAPVDAPRRPDAVYLYGIDVMSTADVKAYFGDYGPKFVEWINDSSCCVLFADAASAARAIVGTGHPLPPEQQAPDASGQAGLDPTSIESLPYLWHKGRDFMKGGTPVTLMYRMATLADKKDTSAPRRSRYLWKDTASGGSSRGGRRKRAQAGDDYDGGQHSRTGAGANGAGASDGMDGYEEYGGDDGNGSGGDAAMRRGRGERGGQQLRRQRRKRVKQIDGSYRDVDMQDAEGSDAAVDEGDGGGQGAEGEGGDGDRGYGSRRNRRRERRRGGGGSSGGGAGSGGEGEEEEDPNNPEAVATAAAATAERFGVSDLRELLRRKGGGSGAAAAGGLRAAEEERIDRLGPDAFEEVAVVADDEAENGGGGS